MINFKHCPNLFLCLQSDLRVNNCLHKPVNNIGINSMYIVISLSSLDLSNISCARSPATRAPSKKNCLSHDILQTNP